MSRIRSKNTKPELSLRRALFARCHLVATGALGVSLTTTSGFQGFLMAVRGRTSPPWSSASLVDLRLETSAYPPPPPPGADPDWSPCGSWRPALDHASYSIVGDENIDGASERWIPGPSGYRVIAPRNW